MFDNQALRRGFTAACVAAVALTGTIGTLEAAEKFMFGHTVGPDHLMGQASDRFVETIGKDDRFELEYQPGGSLGDWTSLFEQTVRGVLPMSLTFGVADVDARFDVAFLAYIADDWDKARELYGPGGKMLGFYQSIAKDHDLVIVGTIPVDFAGIAMRKGQGTVPTNFPEDGNGIKMRVPGLPVAVKRFEAWGFSPVPMPSSELYSALQLGTVDGRAFGPPPEIWEMRDVLESYVFTRDYFEHALWLVNKSWWEGLTDEKRAGIQAAVDEASSWAWEMAESQSQETLKKIQDYGIEFVQLTDEQMAAAKRLVYTEEWPFMEEKLGAETMIMLREIAGVSN